MNHTDFNLFTDTPIIPKKLLQLTEKQILYINRKICFQNEEIGRIRLLCY